MPPRLKDSPPAQYNPSIVDSRFLLRLRALSIEALHRMFVPTERMFVFRLDRVGAEVVASGMSPRYTAITLLGLAKEAPTAVDVALHGVGISTVCSRVAAAVLAGDNIGDVAMALWAASELQHSDADVLRDRLLSLSPLKRPCPTVELSWVLMAACKDRQLVSSGFVHEAASRLLQAFNPRSGVFAHVTGATRDSLRAHIACFADFVYPIQSLAEYHKISADERAIGAAQRCAEQAIRTQGPEGQWWWHYDWRTGDVVEGYPVYTVHQHGMGPMALFALQGLGDRKYDEAISRSVAWLAFAPEIGRSTIDPELNLIWRKVARREPRKLARKLQAVATRIHPSMRIPSVDCLLPPTATDYECRPYELGWLLFAWPEGRAANWLPIDSVAH